MTGCEVSPALLREAIEGVRSEDEAMRS
jgi:hypothetical protein